MTEHAVQRATNLPLKKLGRKRILVAEDNVINQKLVLLLLSRLGYNADLAENGADALKLLEGERYDAIIMDINMPVMDGIEATREIRRLDGDLGRIPIIAFTANPVHSARRECFAAGMNDFLSKPIDQDQFAFALQRWTRDPPALGT